MVISISFTFDSIDAESYEKSVHSDSCGAVATFKGTTRDNFQGKRVVSLEYEAYEPMAYGVLNQIAEEAMSKFGVYGVCIVHRLGNVPVGETSVLIATSSTHRTNALQAVSYTIDEVKSRAPIWKKEMYSDSSMWKQNSEWIYNSS